jgi:hypothetical protein
MNADYAARREDLRRRIRRNLVWIIPSVLVVGTGLFFGLGYLVAWLWRVTLVDIFAIKPISFWQAWGLILLAQILFKANVQPTMRTGRWGRRAAECDPAGVKPEPPLRNPEGSS